MQNTQPFQKPSYPKILLRVYIFYLLLIICVFLLAGHLDYWQGWLFTSILIALVISVSIFFTDKKDLLQERFHPGPGIKSWDKIFFRIYLLISACIFVISALDTGRFNWSPPLPLFVYIIAYVILLLSIFVIFWAMGVNKFFSSRVRIQTDRGHYVIQNGPYRFVRHPGYLAGIFTLISLPLAFGSLFGLIPACMAIVSLIIRTAMEDKFLRDELPGYSDYARKVRFRLFPSLW